MKHVAYVFGILLAVALITVGANAQVVMNEVYSRASGTAPDLDWIELFNASASPVDVSGYKIYDNGGQAGTKPKFSLPASTVIPARGYYVVSTDVADAWGFGLSSGGEKVWLENTGGTIIDSVAFPAMGTDTSYARMPDGSTTWAKNAPLTKGTSNAMIVMNEIYSRASGTAPDLDWIELYNATSSSIDVSGYKIYDNGGQAGTKPKFSLPASTVIPSKGFYVVSTDVADAWGFGLSSGGEKVWLEEAGGGIIDSIAFPALGTDTSYARVPDGSANWTKRSPLSKGLTNGTPTSVLDDAVVTTYALAQNYPNPFNPSTTIRFTLDRESAVRLTVFNLLGQPVATLTDRPLGAGTYAVSFDASNLPSGVYVYRLEAGSTQLTHTMMLLK